MSGQVLAAAEGTDYAVNGEWFRVGRKCDDATATGHWVCTTCGESFPHNWAMQSHASGDPGTDHVVAWVCHAHGPEVP